jgi:class 3 adenylate cyclase
MVGALHARCRQPWRRHHAVSDECVEVDIRAILPTIRVPTLILHRSGDRLQPCEGARYMARQIPAAKFVELPGDDHIPWIGDTDPLLAEVQEFLTGEPAVLEADRVLATALFIDIVQSTQRATAIGDSRWRDLVDNYQQMVGKEVARLGGRVVNTAGDGVFAIFDGPARAIKCARAVRDVVGTLGLAIRCGIHTGECVIEGSGVAGIAVHIGARVAARATPGEILLSSTVKDLIAGSRVECLDRGSHVLKGVAGRWRLFAVKE